ncbi:Outer membrane lipoprotein Blc [Rubrivivax sp. A210]|uniref:lipocalin family protein n=1 Tax=Rubrivivax sp. A210 TaxID=2772301 RepID=UPI001918D350|nr:lipocalin family protein [Rubrivivax sp. A210]CAD5367035.1 Outer membrane lipoprotein Blc [Rubrivivax sp. A210]
MHTRSPRPFHHRRSRFLACGAVALAAFSSHAAEPLGSLDVEGYMGTWHQVAHYPNFFQRQCVRDTRASYRLIGPEAIEVTNRCTTAEGKEESVVGLARPRGATVQVGRLAPAALEVSFLPGWLRWLPVGWGRYDLISLSDDGRVAIVSEPSKNYLWVLSRDKALGDERWQAVTTFLGQAGFDLARLQRDPVSP